MFKKFFMKEEEDEEVYESLDPVLEQRRKEKFSAPLIYNDDDDEVKEIKKPEVKKPVQHKPQQVELNYHMTEIISPISGVQKKYEPEIKAAKPKKVKMKQNSEQLIPIISPFFGSAEYMEEAKEEKKEETKKVEEPSVEKNLRDIANIVKEEQDQLKIIEERTGEFKLDFHNNEDSFIDEIDDSMSLDELMSLYEKKFKD